MTRANHPARTAALKAACAFFAAALLSAGAGVGLPALGGMFLDIWGVTAQNFSRAPAFIRFLFLRFSDIALFLEGLCLLAAALVLARAFGLRLRAGRGGVFALWGALGAIALTALLLALDWVRLGHSLARPAWSGAALFGVLARAASVSGGEALFRGVLYGSLAPYKRAARACSALAFALLFAPALRPVALLNGALLGLVCCLIYERTGGVAGGALFRLCAGTVLFPVMGFPGGGGCALYETYPRALDLATGGAGGPLNALAVTLALAAGCLALLRKPAQRLRPPIK